MNYEYFDSDNDSICSLYSECEFYNEYNRKSKYNYNLDRWYRPKKNFEFHHKKCKNNHKLNCNEKICIKCYIQNRVNIEFSILKIIKKLMEDYKFDKKLNYDQIFIFLKKNQKNITLLENKNLYEINVELRKYNLNSNLNTNQIVKIVNKLLKNLRNKIDDSPLFYIYNNTVYQPN